MGSKNSVMVLADRIARQIIAEQTRARIAISFDGAIIAANKALHMGPGRAGAYSEAYHEAMDWLAEMFISDCDDNKDKRLEYAKAKRDELTSRLSAQRILRHSTSSMATPIWTSSNEFARC